MRNLTELSPAESSNTQRDKANLTPFEVAEIAAMQHRIYDNEYAQFDWEDEYNG